jgi:uncharacterized cupredoxin-like copper-binding protein
VHSAALHFAPILGAEKSKAPFFIAGGLLVAWALIVSVGLGMRRPDFPGNQAGQRIVATITIVLVIGAASTAVITSGSPAKAAPSASNEASTTAAAAQSAPATGGTSTPSTSPKATTGTPAPPSSPAAPAAQTTLKLAANPSGLLSYSTKQLSAKAGKVTIDFTNMSPVEHDVTVAQGNAVAGATPVFNGGSKTLTLSLKPGTYTFYCSVPGHRQAGMEGTLTVS